jgi:hypothetical protein
MTAQTPDAPPGIRTRASPGATATKKASAAGYSRVGEAWETSRFAGNSLRADDGTRTHDLLHGKQTL